MNTPDMTTDKTPEPPEKLLSADFKAALYVLFLALLFMTDALTFYLPASAAALGLWVFYPAGRMRGGALPVAVFLAFTFLANALFAGGEIVFAAFGLDVTREALHAAAVRTSRVFLMIAGAKLLILSAGVEDLAGVVGRAMRPLKILRLPVDDFTEIMAMSLRALPLIRQDAVRRFSQAASDNGANNFSARARLAASLIVPVFISIINHPENIFGDGGIASADPGAPDNDISRQGAKTAKYA
jgi:energy-coupling factor transport system permease protein